MKGSKINLRGELQLDIVAVQGTVQSPKHTGQQFRANRLYTSNHISSDHAIKRHII